MTAAVSMQFRKRPSAIAYHLRGLFPAAGLQGVGGCPSITARWTNHRIDPMHLAKFLALSGLDGRKSVPVLYPHVFGFPLQLAILTHPRFPVSIWRVLQIRNQLVQHRPIFDRDELDLETRIAAQRVLEKGVEFDLRTSVSRSNELVWESVNTFYYRGRFGAVGAASPTASAPPAGDTVVADWHAAAGSGWQFAALTGDYNGIHYCPWYARQLGFRRAFLHPQLALGQCMAHLQPPFPMEPQRLDVWLKGPVYTGAFVRLRAETELHQTTFGLFVEGDERPAIVGRWSGKVTE